MTEMTLTGRLEETPLAEVAGELYRRKKTGKLLLAGKEKSRQVVFYEGNPVAVLSERPEDHIAHFLTVKGKITQEEGARLQELPETKEALQSAGILAKETLTWGLKFRFVNLAYDLFRWEEGTWTFEEGDPPRDIFLMKVPTPTLLSKGVGHMSPSLLMKRMPGNGAIAPGPLSKEEAAGLTAEEDALLGHCSEGRKIQEIIEEEVADPVRTRELLYVLLALGLVSTVSAEPGAPVPEPAPPQASAEPAEEPVTAPEEPEAPAETPADSFEIERHSYGAAAEPSAVQEDQGPLLGAEEEMVPEAPAPPEGLEMSESLQPLGGEDEPEPPPLEMPPPPAEEPKSAEGQARSMYIDPDAAPAAEEGGGLEPLGLEMPAPPVSDLPPPPWQGADETAAADMGLSGGEAGTSPFAPPETAAGDEVRAAISRPSQAKVPKRRVALPSRLLLLLATLGAAVAIGAGIYVGSKSFRSPSTPLPPIPPAEEAKPEMAEDLPVPALPSAVRKAPEDTARQEPSPSPEAQAPAPAPAPPPRAEPAPSPPSAASSSYESGLAAFDAGDYQGAASIWHDMASSTPAAFSVSVVVACQVDTVKNAFADYGAERKVFAVPLKLSDGRSCYRVCMGIFDSKAGAQAAVDALPSMLRRDLSVRSVKSLL